MAFTRILQFRRKKGITYIHRRCSCDTREQNLADPHRTKEIYGRPWAAAAIDTLIPLHNSNKFLQRNSSLSYYILSILYPFFLALLVFHFSSGFHI